MRKLIFVVASMFVFGTASAEHTGNPGGNGYGNTYDYSHTSNKTVSAKARANSDAYSGSSTDGSGNASTYIDQTDNSYVNSEAPASAIPPSAYAAPPTSACVVTMGLSGGAIVGGGALSLGKVNKDCMRLETYRMGMLRPEKSMNCTAKLVFLDTKSVQALADRDIARMRTMVDRECGIATTVAPVTFIKPLPVAEACDVGSYLAKVNGRVQCHNPAFRGERG